MSLLDYRTAGIPHPDVVPLIDTHKERWQGLNALFGKIANQSFQEALMVYRAAWRRGLTTPEIDKLAFASAIGERYDHGYWLKEKIFREIALASGSHFSKKISPGFTTANSRNTPAASRKSQLNNTDKRG